MLRYVISRWKFPKSNSVIVLMKRKKICQTKIIYTKIYIYKKTLCSSNKLCVFCLIVTVQHKHTLVSCSYIYVYIYMYKILIKPYYILSITYCSRACADRWSPKIIWEFYPIIFRLGLLTPEFWILQAL